ncbi:guanine nucleotide exchange factor [Scleroderma citrinum]
MSAIVSSYVALPLSAATSDVNAAFRVVAPSDTRTSTALAQLVLDDLKATLLDNTVSRLSKQGATQAALPKLKDLGKTPEVAAILSSPTNLRCLLSIATIPEVENSKENNALRCIANTCLLVESTRATFISSDVNGGNVCLDLLQRSSSLESIYLTSRILFLCTASIHSARSFIEWMVENKLQNVPSSGTAIDIIATKMDELVHYMVTRKSTGGTTPEDAMTDLLKLVFNLCAHYPKIISGGEIRSPEIAAEEPVQRVIGDYWSPRLDGLIPPLLRAFHNIPPTSPHPLMAPMVHIIHSLITIPVNASNRSLWFGPHPPSPAIRATSNDSATSSSCSSPNLDSYDALPAKEPRPRALDRALSALAAGKRSFSRSRASISTSPPAVPDTAIRACELLDATLAAFFQGDHDPDNANVRNRFHDHSHGDSMSDIIIPLALLITRFALGDEDARLRIRNWFVPANLDRSKPLEGRDDALGRCLRILQSAFQHRLSGCIGEMFFAMYDSNPTNLTTLGYGNFAGFLFNKGLGAAPPPVDSYAESLFASSGLPIDPITGMVQKEREPDGMTEEEKEQEAEKLFMLFDRLERTGALPPGQNPIRRAIQRGSS